MVKIIKEVDLSTCSVSVSRIDRTDLADQIEKAWVGRDHSGIGLPHLEYTYRPVREQYAKYARDTGGKVLYRPGLNRRDIFIVQWHSQHSGFVGSIFVDPDGTCHIQFNGLEKEDRDIIKAEFDMVWNNPENQEFIARQVKWFNDEPWKQVHGMTPAEAVAHLRELGW